MAGPVEETDRRFNATLSIQLLTGNPDISSANLGPNRQSSAFIKVFERTRRSEQWCSVH